MITAAITVFLGLILGIWLLGTLIVLLFLLKWDGWPRSRREWFENAALAAVWPLVVGWVAAAKLAVRRHHGEQRRTKP